ncbi:MAG: carboxymuconolactone decarboxylase family protein [Candidatus Aminicenantes bacterium]|nr:carboxymuconolactone decarboxylase family protein [Candidatus Aminicenantes bacterium]
MSDPKNLVSKAFHTFQNEAPRHAEAWMRMVQSLTGASSLDAKTGALAYLAVLAVLRLESGIPFHVEMAKKAGASREEVISAVLVGLAPAGHSVTKAVPVAIEAYDAG